MFRAELRGKPVLLCLEFRAAVQWPLHVVRECSARNVAVFDCKCRQEVGADVWRYVWGVVGPETSRCRRDASTLRFLQSLAGDVPRGTFQIEGVSYLVLAWSRYVALNN